jgi:hypothetical protein
MSHVLLSQTQSFDTNAAPASRGGTVTLRLNISPVMAMILMMVLIGLMGVLSLTHLNSMSTKGYVIDKLEDDYQELVNDGEINEMLNLQARSLANIQESDQVQAMRAPSNVYYLEGVVGLAKAD